MATTEAASLRLLSAQRVAIGVSQQHWREPIANNDTYTQFRLFFIYFYQDALFFLLYPACWFTLKKKEILP